MTWSTYHRRGEVLRQVIDTANERRDGRLPMDVTGVAETFAQEAPLLGALTLKWHTRLNGHLERALSTQPLSLDEAVIKAWHATAAELPGVLAILDTCRAEPASEQIAHIMRVSTEKEHVMLAVMAGLASTTDLATDQLAAAAGAELANRARATLPSSPASGLSGGRHVAGSLAQRLKAVLSAA